MLFNQLD